MLKLLEKIPNEKFALAFSGGIDSVVVADFLLRFPKNDFFLLHFNHKTEHGEEAESFTKSFSLKHNLNLELGSISSAKLKKESQEEYWRRERYNFFSNYKLPIITCHHLNDCIEYWIFTSLRGEGKMIPSRRDNFLRPFLLTSKTDIKEWAEKNELTWCEDNSNSENVHARNIIRNEMMETCLKVNPGLEKMMKKKLLEKRNAL